MSVFGAYHAIESSTPWGSLENELVQPWLAFVKAKWIPRSANLAIENQPDHELEQRKRLVKEWMGADQGFRDAYVNLASTLSPSEVSSLRQGFSTNGPHESDNPNYIPSKYPLILTSTPTSTPTRLAWARLIFLTRFDSMGTCFNEPAPHYTPRPGTPTIDPFTFATTYLPQHCPNFNLLGMDPHGNPYIYRHIYQFVDAEEDLHQGSKLVVEYSASGTIARSKRLAAYFGKNDENKACAMGHGWFDLVEEMPDWEEESEGIDVLGLGMLELARKAGEAMGVEVQDEEVREMVEEVALELL